MSEKAVSSYCWGVRSICLVKRSHPVPVSLPLPLPQTPISMSWALAWHHLSFALRWGAVVFSVLRFLVFGFAHHLASAHLVSLLIVMSVPCSIQVKDKFL